MSGLADAALVALKLAGAGFAALCALWLLVVVVFAASLRWETRNRRRSGGTR